MSRWPLTIILFAVLLGCQTPEARRPVQQRSGSFVTQSAERNKDLYQQESAMLQSLIERDSVRTYYTTEQGFWYTYDRKDTADLPTPIRGDLVRFRYSISDLDRNELLSATDQGWIDYRVDQSNQELISGIRQGIKFIKPGEQVTFLFPSYFAYGYYGLQGLVGRNQPVYCTIELESIAPTNSNNTKSNP